MMQFELWVLFVVSVLYLGLLFLIATAAERKWLPSSLVRHPLVYALSLGVYATSWSYYGSVGLADRQGYTFLAVYLGVTLAFLASPVLLRPILRLVRQYQLSSLADLMAFRYHSQAAGVLVTLFMLTGALPYMALQIQAVTDTLRVLTGDTETAYLAQGFSLTMTLFAILFGARHLTPREKHEGLVLAIAFESLVKLIALMVVGAYAVFGIFNGLDGFSRWVDNNPQATEALMRPIHEGPWGTMLLLAFSAAFLLPRQFHMIFVENIRSANLRSASWLFPLFLLLLNLSIPPILWAGQSLDLSYGADLYVLGVSMQSQSALLPVFIFIGGISAASAMIIVTTIALASMSLNHLILPLRMTRQKALPVNLYRLLIWGKRILIVLIIQAGFAFYLFLQTHQELTDLGLISFVAVAQFLPGLFGLLYWRRANRSGFVIGLLAGALLWISTLILPLFARAGWLQDSWLQALMLPMSSTDSAQWTLMLNAGLFVLVSLLRGQDEPERRAAEACVGQTRQTGGAIPQAASLQQFEARLAEITGAEMAAKEVSLALQDLGLEGAALGRGELARLRQQIRHNLSGLVGPVLANMVVTEQLAVDGNARVAIADTIRFVEKSLAGSRLELKEMAGELDALRRFHHQVLHELPLAVVTLSSELQVTSWNAAMEQLSGLRGDGLLGQTVTDLPAPWNRLLADFIARDETVQRGLRLRMPNGLRILNLFRSTLQGPTQTGEGDGAQGFVIVIEDHSEIHQLETELAHSERLASIGRLATGVAHEIGNPVTGIACLAQDIRAEPDNPGLARRGVEDILRLTGRISDIVQSLVRYSHAGAGLEQRNQRVRLGELAREAIGLVSLSRKGKQIDFRLGGEDDEEIDGDYQKLLQLLVNLLSNAVDASDESARVEIRWNRMPDGGLQLSVIDQGHGIEPQWLTRIYDPFFTTKQAGEGTGLGLSLAWSIVRDHGGRIEVHSEPGSGSEFIVTLGGAREETKHE